MMCASCLACTTRAAPRPDSTALAEAVAATINSEGPEETAPGYSTVRTSRGSGPWDAQVATILRTRYSARFRADDDSLYVRRIATSGYVYRGDTAFVTAVAAICLRYRTHDPFTLRGTSTEYRFLPVARAAGDSGPRWRSIGAGQIGILDGDCQTNGWSDHWWQAGSPAKDH